MRRLLVQEVRRGGSALRYYLLAEEVPAAGELYGVQAELNGEAASVPGITISQRRVQGLLDCLVQGRVTPVALRDVVEDWLLA